MYHTTQATNDGALSRMGIWEVSMPDVIWMAIPAKATDMRSRTLLSLQQFNSMKRMHVFLSIVMAGMDIGMPLQAAITAHSA